MPLQSSCPLITGPETLIKKSSTEQIVSIIAVPTIASEPQAIVSSGGQETIPTEGIQVKRNGQGVGL